jgi:hypothetical protein
MIPYFSVTSGSVIMKESHMNVITSIRGSTMRLRRRFNSLTKTLSMALTFTVVCCGAVLAQPDDKAITRIAPNSAWLFGGLVAEISGRDFSTNAQVFFGESEAEVLAVSGNSETLWVVVPPLVTDVTTASITVDVLVRDLERDSRLLQGFTYVQRALEDNLVVNAFFFDPGADFNATMQLGAGQEAALSIPVADRGLTVPGIVGGLFRAGNNPISLGTSAVGGVPPVSSYTEFDIHLYEDITESLPLRPSAPALREITDWSYPALEEENRIAVEVPLPSVNLQTNDVQKGLTIWRPRTFLDYRTLTSTYDAFPFVVYETTILGSDTDPNAVTAPAGSDLLSIRVRLNGTGAAALRRNTVPPPDVAQSITVDNASATSGDRAGGASLRLIAPLGGLAWVDRVEFQAIDGTVVAVATPADFQSAPGLTGLELRLTVPAAQCTGPVNLAIYLKARPQISFAVLPQAFTYTGDGPDCSSDGTPGGCAAASLTTPMPPVSGDALVLAAAIVLLLGLALAPARVRLQPQD